MISYEILDGNQIDFISEKPPYLRKRTSRVLTEGFLYEEYRLIDELKRRNFIYQISPIYALITKNVPNVKISLRMITGLARFLSIQLPIRIYREHYRRFNSKVFWMHYTVMISYCSSCNIH